MNPVKDDDYPVPTQAWLMSVDVTGQTFTIRLNGVLSDKPGQCNIVLRRIKNHGYFSSCKHYVSGKTNTPYAVLVCSYRNRDRETSLSYIKLDVLAANGIVWHDEAPTAVDCDAVPAAKPQVAQRRRSKWQDFFWPFGKPRPPESQP